MHDKRQRQQGNSRPMRKSGDIEVGRGDECAEGLFSVVPEVQVDERWAVLHEESQASVDKMCMNQRRL